jgi:uncharacterized protein (DUF2236 family)
MTDGPAPGGVGAGTGLFGPDSLSWRVNREAVLLLGGPRALLLQLAHPLVAAGVAEHSDFLRDPVGRLRRTLTTMLSIVFGDAATVAESAARIADTHARVRGTLRQGTRSFPAGSVYDASDPRLLLWVHATLVDSALVTYEWLVAPLTASERARFYEESKTLARLLGVPDRELPDSYPSFARYVADMLDGPLAEITPTARRLGRSVLEPPIPLLPPGLSALAELVTAGLSPPGIRASYGLVWDHRRARAHGALGRIVQTLLPWIPDLVRAMPQARDAGARTVGR